jgi:hypothetical protein
MPMETPTTESIDASEPDEGGHAVTVSQLQAELQGGAADAEAASAIGDIVADVEASLFEDEGFSFAEGHVKSSLDELLITLVAVRSSETHGKRLLDDLAEEFDTILSPGTVYPRLHDLCDAEILEQRELVKTKEYTLADVDAAREDVVDAARQHLALGMVLHAALKTGDFA